MDSMKKTSKEIRFDKIREMVGRGYFNHSVYHPVELVDEILDSTRIVENAKILVLYNPEFAVAILEDYETMKPENIYLLHEDDETLVQLGSLLGINTMTMKELQLTMEEDMKFDLVIGNPPFQTPGDRSNKSRKYNLWSEFLEKSMEWSDTVSLVLPDGWMASGAPTFEAMKSFGFVKANIHECAKHFKGIGVGFTYVILNRSHEATTEIVMPEDTIVMDFNEVSMISPNPEHWKILQKLTRPANKQGWRRGQGYHTSSKSDWESKRGRYTVFHTAQQSFKTNQVKGDQTSKKVIIPMTSAKYPIYDNGNLGVAQATVVLPVSNLRKAKKVFDSKLYTWIFHKLASQQGALCLRLMKEIGEVDLSQDWCDSDLYSRFKLNKREIALIESEI